jgi:hypothetical protein
MLWSSVREVECATYDFNLNEHDKYMCDAGSRQSSCHHTWGVPLVYMIPSYAGGTWNVSPW